MFCLSLDSYLALYLSIWACGTKSIKSRPSLILRSISYFSRPLTYSKRNIRNITATKHLQIKLCPSNEIHLTISLRIILVAKEKNEHKKKPSTFFAKSYTEKNTKTTHIAFILPTKWWNYRILSTDLKVTVKNIDLDWMG